MGKVLCNRYKMAKCMYGEECYGDQKSDMDKFCWYYAPKRRYEAARQHHSENYARLSDMDKVIWRDEYLEYCRENFLVPIKLSHFWAELYKEWKGKVPHYSQRGDSGSPLFPKMVVKGKKIPKGQKTLF